ncbi:MAG: CPBP family intramembrane metalloprotease [Deltaproteobacteria bacterium]|nr:CPBP family intramembrane metalloprotease [Deltaproteobacteria bacterium]
MSGGGEKGEREQRTPSSTSGSLAGVSRVMAIALGVYHLFAITVTHYHKWVGAGVVIAGLILFAKPLGRLLHRHLVTNWRVLDQEAAEARAADGDSFDFRPIVVLVTSAVVLTMIEYFGDRGTYHSFMLKHARAFTSYRFYDLTQYAYWSGFRIIFYVMVPWLVVLAIPGERIRDYGLKVGGIRSHLWVYVLLFAIILPALVMVSQTTPFQRTYPFYKLAVRSWGDFFAWEALYALQFFALEVFFRGFMIHPLKRALGSHAIFVMAVPYCMIHYNKPLVEVLGAVIAGTILGTLSLRTRSIWCGVLVHVTVAVTMDGLAIHQVAGYPGNPRYIG